MITLIKKGFAVKWLVSLLAILMLAASCEKPKDCSKLDQQAKKTQNNMDNSFEGYSKACGLICDEYDMYKIEKPNANFSKMTFEGCKNDIDIANKIVNIGIPAYASNSTNSRVLTIKQINSDKRVPDSTSYELYKKALVTDLAAAAECHNQ